MLAKEQELCGYLKLDREYYCVHIPNITEDLQKQLNKMCQVAEDSKVIQKASEINWFNEILQGIGGWSLKGWLAGILETIIIIVVIIVIIGLAISCVHKIINPNFAGMYATTDKH